MENQNQVDDQKQGRLEKGLYLIVGIILGLGLWVLIGLAYMLSAENFNLPKGAYPWLFVLFIYALPIALLVWIMDRATTKKFIVYGTILFFVAAFLIPNPCSITSLLNGLVY